MTVNYYESNAIYDYLLKEKYNNFLFAKKDIWFVVYGNDKCEPKLLVVIMASTREHYLNLEFTELELSIIETARKLSDISGIDYKLIRYCKDESELFCVQYINYKTKRYKNIQMNHLAKVFAKYGIGTTLSETSETKKYLNDKISSAFHKWQREVLGNNITASDIDLIKFENDEMSAIYELKRSVVPIDKWKPYSDDYANFKLISKFADMANLEFKIVYNQRRKNPYCDDISKLKLFSFDYRENRSNYCDTVILEDFLKGRYHG